MAFAWLLLLLPWNLTVSVRTEDGRPLPQAEVRVEGAWGSRTGFTDSEGVVKFVLPEAGECRIGVRLEGYHPASKVVHLPAEVEFALAALQPRVERVEVAGEPADAEQPSAESARQTPQRPAALRDALPLIPGVARTVEGKLIISDAAEHRATMLVNSLDATDPATGKFGATIPMDAVAAFNVYKNPFLAEYGRFSTGVVIVETQRGGDRWRWVLNDPTPELRIRSGRLRGIRGFTPRLSVGGPWKPGRFYVWQSLEYVFKETPVRTQPFPLNEQRRQSWNGLTQLDWFPSGSRVLTLTAHAVPERLDHLGLDFYNPRQATASFRGREQMASLTDQWRLAGGRLESAVSFGEVKARVRPQGDEALRMFPDRHEGHYPFRQERRARRWQWRESYTAPARAGHHLKLGGWLMRATMAGGWQGSALRIHDLDGRLLRSIAFLSRPGFRLCDWETSWFVHDEWTLGPRWSINLGVRADTQSLAAQLRLAPRFSLAWTPFGDRGTVWRAGYGWFFDRLPLNVFAFPFYPEAVAHDRRPNVLDSTRLSPRARVWSAQWDQKLGSLAELRVRHTESRAERLLVVRPEPGRLRLAADGRSASRQLEFISRLRLGPERELLVSYVYGRTRAHLNDFAEFLGDVPPPLIRPDYYATAPGNIPHRFLLWGAMPVSGEIRRGDEPLWPPSFQRLQPTRGWRLAPVLEYRSGFPFSALDAAQNYAEPPNQRRFPNFFSLDLRISKDIAAGGRRTARISFSAFNLSNHFNPESVRWNTADPQFGEFLGQRPRRFRVDFDIYF